MAQYNSIQITFHKDLNPTNYVKFSGIFNSNGIDNVINFVEVWTTLRLSPNTVTTGTPTVNLGERSAINFRGAFLLDYVEYGFQVLRVGNVVTIKSTISNSVEGWKGFTENTEEAVPSDDVSFVYLNLTSQTIDITHVAYSNSGAKQCEDIKVSILFSQVPHRYKIGQYDVSGNTDNPVEIILNRALGYILQVWTESNQLTQHVIETPGWLDPTQIAINVVWSPNGSSINIVNNLPTLPVSLNVAYSLNDEDWQYDNTFSGLEPGEYTLYIRDTFGCKKTKNFLIAGNGINVPYFLYDKNNSFRMAYRIEFGTGSNYPNDENTLSCEAFAVDERFAYKEIQRFQTNDVITTQFKSNYPTNKAYIVLEKEGTEIEIPVIQKSNNIGKTDLRDAFICDLGNGKSGIYFTLGSLYDFNTGLPTGESYGLYGSLPLWNGLTNYILVQGTWYVIQDVIYDDIKNVEMFVIDKIHTGSDTLIKAGTIFNLHNYEVYEFDIDFDSYINKKLRVKIEAISDEWQNITLLSELIDIKVFHPDCIEIRYWNDENTNINYQTGIKHLLRIPIHQINGKSVEEFENKKTDSSTVLVSSEVYEATEFKFEPLTLELWRKVIRALSCQHVFINNVEYVKNSEFETEGPLGDSNLYVLTANMIKSGNTFSSQSDGVDILEYGGTEVPGLIHAGSQTYIKY